MVHPVRKKLATSLKQKAGHYEVLGETIAKLEFFEHGWNPYTRFLDVDKVDLILRRKVDGRVLYREVQVKYGKLYRVGTAFEKLHFDLTSWRFFKEDAFAAHLDQAEFFVAYVLSTDDGYRGDFFVFPVRDFAQVIGCGIPSKGQRKVYFSHLADGTDRWVLRRLAKFQTVDEVSCLDVTRYRRAFGLLEPTLRDATA